MLWGWQRSQVPGVPDWRGGGQAVNAGVVIVSEHAVGKRALW